MKNVVAACQSYKFAETQKGDPYFSLTGIVKDPEEMIGRRATFMWFINESEWATVEDNLTQLANDLSLLGVEMPEDLDDLPPLLAELCERGVHLLFNTGAPRKNGRSPNLFIQGLAEDFEDEPQEGAGEAPERPGRGKKPSPKEEAEEEEETTKEETTEAEEPAEEDWEPAKGEQYYYTPKGKKKTLVEVVKVDKKTKTVDVKTVKAKPPASYKAVKWTALEGE